MDTLTQLSAALSGRYAIDRDVGHGGMATVYLARDVRHDRQVALKVLNPELGAVLGVERFLSEIRVTANLQHTNILPLFDSGEASLGGYAGPGASLLFYVMPYVEGESLRSRLEREKQLPVDEAVRIATAIAGALDYAHRSGVIHRDLKPENILLHEGQPLIADFGIALAVSNAGGSRVTQTGLSLGTPQYMSPEQATGDRAIDRRSDIYSLGAVLYEMLTGEPPHAAATAQAIIARLLTETPRSVRVERPSVPEYLDAVVGKALEKLPADRFGTAGEFADALSGKTAIAPGPVARRRDGGGRFTSRLKDPVTLVLAALLTITVVLAAVLAFERGSREPDVIRFGIQSGRLSPDNFVGAPLAVSPDGHTIVFTGDGRDNNGQLYVRSLSYLDPVPIPGSEGAFMPFFSPDGRWVGFWAGGRLQKVLLGGGQPLVIAETPVILGAAWSRKGLIVVSTGNALSVVPDVGGTVRRLDTTRHAASGDQFPVLLDDDLVAFSRIGGSSFGGGELGIASVTTERIWMLGVPGTAPVGYLDGFLIYVNPPNGLFAVPVDLRRKVATGDPISLPADVLVGAGGSAKAALSASGTLAYHAGAQTARAVAISAAGGVREFLPGDGVWSYPRFSPDGGRLAMTVGGGARTDIWIHDLASATMTRLTTEGRVNERPEWSPDGRRVIFRTDRSGRSAIWWQPVDRSGPAEPLLQSATADYYEAVMTPDGTALVYQLDTLQSDLYFRRLTGDTTPVPLATSRFPEDMARVSPDGRWLAFQTEESGRRQVVVQPLPGPAPRIQISSDGGAEPVWSRDGRRLFYRNGRRLYEALLAAEPGLRVVSRRVVFEGDVLPASAPHANYDVLPDGSGLLVLAGIGEPTLVVILNWGSELRAIVRNSR